MKRLLSLAVFIFCVLVASSKIIGDVNGDEKISAADVATLVSYLIDDNIQYDSRLADVDENGIVDNGDVTALVEIILGLREAKQLVEDDVDTLIIKYTDEGEITFNLVFKPREIYEWAENIIKIFIFF